MLDSALCYLICEPGGFVMGRVIAGEAELLTLAVAPEARRQGIGTRLVAEFLAQARLRGAEAAFLEVSADNAAAMGIYTRAGFAPVGRRKGYYVAVDGARSDALVLSRRIFPGEVPPTALPAPVI
ncbi:MAG: GNAT family N-acetyltransferase [Paracoccaceae bacterium]